MSLKKTIWSTKRERKMCPRNEKSSCVDYMGKKKLSTKREFYFCRRKRTIRGLSTKQDDTVPIVFYNLFVSHFLQECRSSIWKKKSNFKMLRAQYKSIFSFLKFFLIVLVYYIFQNNKCDASYAILH